MEPERHVAKRPTAMISPDDSERTVVKRAPGSFGKDVLGEHGDALPPSTRLHEFEILSVIGQGGFGIVYLAHDTTLDRRVAIKEYMPSSLATRTQELTVAVRSQRHSETFAAGLRSFINEARLLARFDHPSLLKVHRFWEAHGTAYMAMPYYAGITFAKQLTQLGARPDEARLMALLLPLLDALEPMHAAHCFHRDIAPDNILMLPDGRPLLLDFGAARHVIGDMTQAPTVILKAGYAPVEQYGAMPEMAQGAWTDLYALGSVIEFAITGQTPPQAVGRYLGDKRDRLAVRAAGLYSDGFLRAIDQSLAVLPKDRPQSVAQMRALLLERTGRAALPTLDDAVTQALVQPLREPPPPTIEQPRRAEPQATTLRQAPAAAAAASAAAATKAALPASPATAATTLADRRAIVLGVIAFLIVLAAAALYAWLGQSGPEIASPGPSNDATPSSSAPVAAPYIEPPAAGPVTTAPEPQSAAPTANTTEPAETPRATAPATERQSTPVAPAQPPRVAATAAPRVATETARPAPAKERTPNTKLQNARCEDIIQRTSLGEEISDADKALLKRECRS